MNWNPQKQEHVIISCFVLLKSRSSRLHTLFKVDVLKNFIIFIGELLCWSLFLIKLQVFRPSTLMDAYGSRLKSRKYRNLILLLRKTLQNRLPLKRWSLGFMSQFSALSIILFAGYLKSTYKNIGK